MLTTRDARLMAAEWVRAEAVHIPEFVGAVLAGSARERALGDPHPATSDLDVWIVVDAAVPDTVAEPESHFAVRKLHHRGVVIERARGGDPRQPARGIDQENRRREGRPEVRVPEDARGIGQALPREETELGRSDVERASAELERAYDAAVEVRRTPFGLDYNVSRDGRTLALGGVREIAAEHPREAMGRLLFLRSLVQNVLEHDASVEARERFREGYLELLSSMGLDTDARRAARVAGIRALLPRLRAGCEEILSSTPGVLEDGA